EVALGHSRAVHLGRLAAGVLRVRLGTQVLDREQVLALRVGPQNLVVQNLVVADNAVNLLVSGVLHDNLLDLAVAVVVVHLAPLQDLALKFGRNVVVLLAGLRVGVALTIQVGQPLPTGDAASGDRAKQVDNRAVLLRRGGSVGLVGVDSGKQIH